jgi:hypothetical protein
MNVIAGVLTTAGSLGLVLIEIAARSTKWRAIIVVGSLGLLVGGFLLEQLTSDTLETIKVMAGFGASGLFISVVYWLFPSSRMTPLKGVFIGSCVLCTLSLLMLAHPWNEEGLGLLLWALFSAYVWYEDHQDIIGLIATPLILIIGGLGLIVLRYSNTTQQQ